MPGATDGTYNYRHFTFSTYGPGVDRNVGAGEEAADGTVYTPEGEAVELSGLWAERPVVLEFGSTTCPIFVEKSPRMDALAREYAGEVEFVVVYAREAHPGRYCPPHDDLEGKRGRARRLASEAGVERTLLVDDVAGSVHRAYDALPNSVHVVGRDGIVSYRADWIEPDDLAAHLEALLAADGRAGAVDPVDVRENFHPPTPARLRALLRVTRRAGIDSLTDLLTELPSMLRYRLRATRSG